MLGPTLDPRTLGMREVHRCRSFGIAHTVWSQCDPKSAVPEGHWRMHVKAAFVVDGVIATDIGDGQSDLPGLIPNGDGSAQIQLGGLIEFARSTRV